jgi:hypothetical protein
VSILAPSTSIAQFDFALAEGESFFQGWTKGDPPVYDPYLSGYSLIKWIKIPVWLTASKITGIGSRFANFAALTEKNFRNFSGISSIDMSPVETQEGHGGSPTAWAGNIQRFQGFSMTHRELSGSPIRSAYSFWVSSIRDPQTNVATYPKSESIEYMNANHTAELLYISTRPDADNNTNSKIIEFACLFTMVMPLRIPLDHLNYQGGGSNDVAEIEMPFTGIPNISPQVDNFAVAELAKGGAFEYYHSGAYAPPGAAT